MISIYKYTEQEIKAIVDSAVILVDSREKENKHITDYFDKKGIKWATTKLDYGDYSIRIESPAAYRDLYLTDIIAIERKANLNEISGNLTHNRERFEAEFERAKGKIYLLLENTNFDDIERGNYTTKFNKKAFRASLTKFEHKYDLHITYMKDTTASGYWIYTTLTGCLIEKLKQGLF
ncbi:MAG: hypothetical protein E7231_00295 [Cellulosilyticum sp.]|nr:hypothetical protein [Cellulosilyticum sp.]